MAVFTSEFDFLRRDAEAIANRAKKLGKLLDISIIPGAMHAMMGEDFATSEAFKQFLDDHVKGFNTWIKK